MCKMLPQAAAYIASMHKADTVHPIIIDELIGYLSNFTTRNINADAALSLISGRSI